MYFFKILQKFLLEILFIQQFLILYLHVLILSLPYQQTKCLNCLVNILQQFRPCIALCEASWYCGYLCPVSTFFCLVYHYFKFHLHHLLFPRTKQLYLPIIIWSITTIPTPSLPNNFTILPCKSFFYSFS